MENRRVSNFRTLFILLHTVGYIFFICSNSYFSQSFHSEKPIYFLFISVALGISLKCYSNACKSPGFVTEEPENPQGLFFCEVCKQHIPIRACHCKVCGKCVHRRDHHCPWIGHCIGRDNHVYFVTFLIIENIVMGFIVYDVIINLFVSQPTVLQYFYINWINLALVGPLLFAWIQTLLLFYQHSLLIIHNGTIWESVRRFNITYFKVQPSSKNPFDRGILENIKEFLTMKKKKMIWDPPPPPNLKDFDQEVIQYGKIFKGAKVPDWFLSRSSYGIPV